MVSGGVVLPSTAGTLTMANDVWEWDIQNSGANFDSSLWVRTSGSAVMHQATLMLIGSHNDLNAAIALDRHVIPLAVVIVWPLLASYKLAHLLLHSRGNRSDSVSAGSQTAYGGTARSVNIASSAPVQSRGCHIYARVHRFPS